MAVGTVKTKTDRERIEELEDRLDHLIMLLGAYIGPSFEDKTRHYAKRRAERKEEETTT